MGKDITTVGELAAAIAGIANETPLIAQGGFGGIRLEHAGGRLRIRQSSTLEAIERAFAARALREGEEFQKFNGTATKFLTGRTRLL